MCNKLTFWFLFWLSFGSENFQIYDPRVFLAYRIWFENLILAKFLSLFCGWHSINGNMALILSRSLDYKVEKTQNLFSGF